VGVFPGILANVQKLTINIDFVFLHNENFVKNTHGGGPQRTFQGLIGGFYLLVSLKSSTAEVVMVTFSVLS